MDIVEFLLRDKYLGRKFIIDNGIDYNSNEESIIKHNKNFIKRKLVDYKTYFDDMFKEIDPNINLDEEQRIAILTDEDYNLIVAGAGSGKTTTMLAKIKYMIEKCNIDPKQILALSFARKNANEFDHKINKVFKLGVDVMTFHQLGNKIISETEDSITSIIDDSGKYKIINRYFNEELYKDRAILAQLVDFLVLYSNGDKAMENFNSLKDYNDYRYETLFKTLEGNLTEYIKDIEERRKKYRRTINSEYVRSYEEVTICNFLYLYGLEYEYESVYIDNDRENSYRPDFKIIQGERIVYLEHFGINENGSSKMYDDEALAKYKHNINIKEQRHLRNGTKLIKTFSRFNDGIPLLDHLRETLIECGFVLKRRSEEEIFNKLKETNSDSYFYSYTVLVMEFLSQYKLNGGNKEKLNHWINTVDDDRTKKFLVTFYPIYIYYENNLGANNQIDFENMIIKSTDKIKKIKESDLSFNYNYLIIDEYQDISRPRYNLVKELSDFFDASITAVGDDWQSIFKFAGSDVGLFTHFNELMGYGELLKIQQTYRNAQELIDVASEFIQKDNNHIKKTLKSTKHICKPIVVYSYDDEYFDSRAEALGISVTSALNDILKENENSKTLIIGRYNFDEEKLFKSGLFKYKNNSSIESIKFPNANIEFSTVHRSKGLEYDNVIIANVIDSKFGFPSKVKDDPIFSIFNDNGVNENVSFAEERRLFYVALTRTKNKVYITVPKSKLSPFLIEIKENLNVEFKDDVIEQYLEHLDTLKCPICGSYLRKEHVHGLDDMIYRCSQEKEVCDFMTIELKHKVPIKKCFSCEDGYMIYKTVVSNGSLLIGCTNYKDDDTGCNNTYFKSQKVVEKLELEEVGNSGNNSN